MNRIEQRLRETARRYLPARVRRPFGLLAGTIHERLTLPLLGLVFDLKGGRFRADGCTFRIPKDITTRGYRACFLDRTYEEYELQLIPQFIQPNDRVLELGGCLGIVSCVTNKLLADKSQHVVVEANPFCLPGLYRNRELNQAGFLVEHCVVDARPEATFFLHRFITGSSSHIKTARPVRLPGKSLRQLERERGPFTALIIDIEGSELEVFEASPDLLKGYRLVIAELHEWVIGAAGVERCRQILRDSGLKFIARGGIVEAWRRE